MEPLGRDRELAAIERLLDGATARPALLTLEGEAGLGKTTLVRTALARARRRGFHVLGVQRRRQRDAARLRRARGPAR